MPRNSHPLLVTHTQRCAAAPKGEYEHIGGSPNICTNPPEWVDFFVLPVVNIRIEYFFCTVHAQMYANRASRARIKARNARLKDDAVVPE